jgi:hypothetical protein
VKSAQESIVVSNDFENLSDVLGKFRDPENFGEVEAGEKNRNFPSSSSQNKNRTVVHENLNHDFSGTTSQNEKGIFVSDPTDSFCSQPHIPEQSCTTARTTDTVYSGLGGNLRINKRVLQDRPVLQTAQQNSRTLS